jgi:DNA replication and repair protein RecF
VEVSVGLSAAEPKQARLDGVPLRSAEQLRSELTALVFTPDRLVVVKGGPAARRAYLDRSLGRLYPARSQLSIDYAAAVGQRNAALRRVGAGASDRDALAPWTAQVADLGAMLTAARRDVIELLQPGFAMRAAELGLENASLGYDAEPVTIAALEARLDRDLERGSTSAGPHLDEIAIRAAERDLRTFGSQGEQRLAVLALILAEAELIATRRKVPPLLLLDDALSELDESRRRILSERIGSVGQTIVTATGQEALPLAPAQLLLVTPGRAVVA